MGTYCVVNLWILKSSAELSGNDLKAYKSSLQAWKKIFQKTMLLDSRSRFEGV